MQTFATETTGSFCNDLVRTAGHGVFAIALSPENMRSVLEGAAG